MNIFKINTWILLFFFTVPCLFLSETPYVISGLYFIFFLLYFFQLTSIKANGDTKNILRRNKVECGFLLLLYFVYSAFLIFTNNIFTNKGIRFLLSITYIGIFIDLSIGFTRLFLKNADQYQAIPGRIIIFFCMLVPPLGIYYLSHLYDKFYSLQNEHTAL